MADHSSIEWTEATWNPITGCTLVSDGCRHCYAARLAATRLKHHPSRKGLARLNAAGEAKFTGEVRFNEEWLDQPLRWKRPRTIFVCAHGDLFHEGVPDEWIDRVFAVMALAPQHTFQVLTKRSKRMLEYVTDWELPEHLRITLVKAGKSRADLVWPLANVWLGVSAEDQATADERVPDLLATPAAIRFVSAEPLLGPIDFTRLSPDGESELDVLRALTWQEIWDSQWSPEATGVDPDEAMEGFLDWYGLSAMPEGLAHPQLDWIIVGGESGDRARPMHPDWPRSIRDQCTAAGTAFFFKQWGNHSIVYDRDVEDPDWRRCDAIQRAHPGGRWLNLAGGHGFHGERVVYAVPAKKKLAGRLLDGVEHNAMPELRP